MRRSPSSAATPPDTRRQVAGHSREAARRARADALLARLAPACSGMGRVVRKEGAGLAVIEFVEFGLTRNSGWPWPEDSWGLDPMFGEDGWCRSCGVPRRPQSGSLVLQRKGAVAEGVWIPN